jgi:hypothetical protein
LVQPGWWGFRAFISLEERAMDEAKEALAVGTPPSPGIARKTRSD